MSENLTGLFSETNKDTATSGVRSLAGTAELTTLASTIASEIIKKVDSEFEDYKEMVAASKDTHDAMDQLITAAYDLSVVDVEFLKELDEAVIEGMLKSQQSKRSRTKGKVMTIDNYKTLMTAGIAENLIRLATGKVKQQGVVRRGSVDFTPEELEELAKDPDRVRKEIRNVQSKKSIMKSKEGFSEEDEKWQQLLVVEAQLKELRGDSTRTIVVDETKNALSELLNGVDITTLKAADAKALIEQAAALVGKEIDND